MKTNHQYQCRWVCRRLPLLAGGELAVEERRKVERHLLGCPDCQERRDSSAGALAVLRRLGEESPSKVDAPSLWPALARQIRQSRHASPALPWWERPLPRPWGFASLTAALGVVLVASIAPPAADFQQTPAPTSVVVAEEDPDLDTAWVPPMAEPAATEPAAPRKSKGSALPSTPGPGELTQVPVKPIEPPSSILRFDYDLDHGTPMSAGNQDPQRTF
jgi:anti-sigma factor RsiW